MQNKFLQFLGLIKKSGNLIEGYNKCEETLGKSRLYLLIFSTDCSDNTRDKFIRYCEKYKVQYIEAYTKEELAQNLGRSEINILAVSNKMMAEKLLQLWNEKE